MSRILALVALGALATPVWADEDHPDTDKLARAVAPFIHARTVAIVHIDLTRLDLDGLFKWLEEQKVADRKQLAQPRQLAAVVQGLHRAGIQSACIVLDLDFQPGEFPLLVLTLAPGAKAADVQRQIGAMTFLLGAASVRTEQRQDCLVVGNARDLKRQGQGKPVERPELARVLGEHKGGAHHLLLFLPEDLRRAAGELVPELPSELGGGSTRPLTRGLRWLALAADLPPKPQLSLAAEAGNARAAKAVADVLQRASRLLARNKDLKEEMPEMSELLGRFQPEAEGNRVHWSLDGDEAITLLRQTISRVHTTAEQVRRSASLHNLLIALISYADAHSNRLPPAVFTDKAGKPLLSWRVHVLPYIDQAALYREFHLDEPWDSEHNKKLIERMPKVFASTAHPELAREGKTTYLLPVGKETSARGKTGPRYPADIPDGTANTIFIVDVEADRAVPWTKPEDLPIDLDNPSKGLADHPGKGFLFGMGDGSVRFVRSKVSKATLRAAFTAFAGDILGSDW